jgi:anti-sigma factor ChrR (cupin superfamily)
MPVHERVIPDLLLDGWRGLAFEPFRAGVEIHWIYCGSECEPSVALLKYAPGAGVPRHRHSGDNENSEYSGY